MSEFEDKWTDPVWAWVENSETKTLVSITEAGDLFIGAGQTAEEALFSVMKIAYGSYPQTPRHPFPETLKSVTYEPSK